MKTLFVICFLLIFSSLAFSQHDAPYTAKAYWTEQNNTNYKYLKEKQVEGKTFTESEQEWYSKYELYLSDYFGKMTPKEQERFRTYKNQWDEDAGVLSKKLSKDTLKKESKPRDTELLLKHIGYSGSYGFTYGMMLNGIFDIQGGMAAGLPLIMAGGGLIMPLINPMYKDINDNSLWLRSHGKLMGMGVGIALGAAIYGENPSSKQMLSLMLGSSVAMGAIGFHLGRTQNWSEGRVSLYRHYGFLTPAVTMSLAYSSDCENPRTYGMLALAGVAGGYLIADNIADRTNFSRGDLIATVGLTLIGTGYGIGFASLSESDKRSVVLLPAGLSVAGTVYGHRLLDGVRLSQAQGRRVNYAAIGGSLIGLGATLAIEPNEGSLYCFIPSSTALMGYLLMLNYYKANKTQDSGYEKKKSKYDFNCQLMPENYFMNKVASKKYMLPLAGFSLKF